MTFYQQGVSHALEKVGVLAPHLDAIPETYPRPIDKNTAWLAAGPAKNRDDLTTSVSNAFKSHDDNINTSPTSTVTD